MKEIIKKYFKNFTYFYRYLRHRIFLSIVLSLIVGLLDGFGLAMFLPLLQMVSGEGDVQAEQLGNLAFLIDTLEGMGIEIVLTNVLLLILFFFTVKGLFKYAEANYKVFLQQKFIKEIRFTNIRLLANFDYRAFVTSDVGRIQNTFSGEVERVLQAYNSYFTAFQYSILVAVYIGLAFLANPQFAILVAIGGGLTNLIFKKIYRKTKELSRNLTNENHSFQGLLIQEVSNFKYLKASGLINAFGEMLKASILKIEYAQRRIGKLASFLASMREPIVIFVVVAVIVIQVSFFSQNLGLIILSLLFFYRSLAFLMAVQNYANVFLSVSGSLENMTEFTKSLASAQERRGGLSFKKFSGKIEIANLNFSYGDESVLKDVSFTFLKNQTLAIVGASGSGKTTLMNIMTGLLPVNEGSFFIDGTDVNKIDIHTYQRRIGYITQEPVVFNASIFNNITFWDEPTPANKERFWHAVNLASINELINELPAKEDTLLGNNGISLSGGQRQRISIARELYKDIDFLFMDEATSALDSETEKVIKENIDGLKGKITILIVAHRLSTVKDADLIIVLNQGNVESVGKFDDLKMKSANFRKMVELQEF